MITRWLAAVLVMLAGPAVAETVVTSVSTPRLGISSNFAGAEIVVFGAIERDASTLSRSGPYQVAIIVTGPLRDVEVRKKSRVGGIWIDRERERITDVPTFLSINTSSPVERIATPALIENLGLTLGNRLSVDQTATGPFREALILAKGDNGLYDVQPFGVAFLASNLFRTTVRLPPNVPLGLFKVETFVFSGSVKVGERRDSFEVFKAGFEARVAIFARDRAPIYGAAVAGLALLFGWLATVIFRRD